ncbi:hypothetical protein GA0061071_103106 [Kosakonia oryzendophytica]|uniref:Uncharacterized protein n=1 Tax=Kosakonia oryzendophytica TaxID=1005665 RepID=A0A1C4AJN7_9ENTR|nr:hypothetical protein [Kosakonia oryzendophytica]AMO50175.1 Hypothetical protein AKI40_3798 [Enterobacter sp. FY-07]TDT60605.1 hypothetical protein DFO53_2237 [Enterobacter sp. AG5470]WBT57163.1 hypothetical protein O9K67_18705 [Kosakonia oryzendophytica]SCB94783.1 hypothetical protein GA0061071_103106 [Kosakonia oryzendophytica]
MKPVEDVINDLQCRALAYEIIFQSLFTELPQFFKDKAIENIELNFKAFESGTQSESGKVKLEAAKAVASRIMGVKLKSSSQG